MAPFQYQFTSPSLKQLQKLPPAIQQQIITKLDYFCHNNPFLFAEKLTDHKLGDFRFRVGKYRVIFDQDSPNLLTIHDVGHRRDIYR